MKHQILFILLILFAINISAQVLEIEVDDVQHYGINVFKENEKFGIKDYDKNEVLIPAEYDNIKQEVKDNFVLNKGYSYYGLYNSKLRKIVLPLEFNEVYINNASGHYVFLNNNSFVVVVRKKDKKGLLDHNYNYIFNIEYDKIEPHETYVRLVKDEKDGIYFFKKISKAIPLIYDQVIEEFPTNCFIAIKNKRYFLFDNTGKLITGDNNLVKIYRHRWSDNTTYDILIIDSKNKCGIYNSSKSRFIVPVKFDKVADVFENQFIVKNNLKFGIINSESKEVVPFLYDTLAFLKPKNIHTLLLASQKQKFGLINLQNKSITGFVFDGIENINGLYKVLENGKYTVVDSLGKKISTMTFDDIGSFYDGKCAVFIKNKMGYMDMNGNIIEPIERLSKARGYKDINELFSSFVKVLKSENDSLLMKFCEAVVYDEYTKEFMLRINYEYRGFPRKMMLSNKTTEDAVKEYYNEIKYFYNKLKMTGQLESLVYSGLDRDIIGYWEKEYNLLGTEARGILITKDHKYDYKLGELIFMDGYWKSFTLPRD